MEPRHVQLIAHKMPGWTTQSVASKAKNLCQRVPKDGTAHSKDAAADPHIVFCARLNACVAQARGSLWLALH